MPAYISYKIFKRKEKKKENNWEVFTLLAGYVCGSERARDTLINKRLHSIFLIARSKVRKVVYVLEFFPPFSFRVGTFLQHEPFYRERTSTRLTFALWQEKKSCLMHIALIEISACKKEEKKIHNVSLKQQSDGFKPQDEKKNHTAH